MDDLASAAAQIDPSKLNDTDKRELQQFLQNEAQKSSIQSSKQPSFSTIFNLFDPRHDTDFFAIYSRPQPHRSMLEEMCPRKNLDEQDGRQGRWLYAELCGQVHGFAVCGTATSGDFAWWAMINSFSLNTCEETV